MTCTVNNHEGGCQMTGSGLRNFPVAVLLVVAFFVLTASITQAGVVEPGHSAAWYSPVRDGEGWIVEIHADDRALMTWFTYDEAGGQRWLIGEGEVVRDEDDGDGILFSELYATRGGRFGDGFDASQVEREVVTAASPSDALPLTKRPSLPSLTGISKSSLPFSCRLRYPARTLRPCVLNASAAPPLAALMRVR